MNRMREIRIEKITLNISTGGEGDKLAKAEKVLGSLTGRKPVRTLAKRAREFGVRTGIPIGCKVTLRGEAAEEFLKRAFEAVERVIKEAAFDNEGNFSFGIKEHIDIPGVKYDPEVGIFGMDVCVTPCRLGYRIKHRCRKRHRIPAAHRVTREEVISFVSQRFGVEVV